MEWNLEGPLGWRLFAMTRFRLQVFVLLGFCTVAYVVSYVVSWFFG